MEQYSYIMKIIDLLLKKDNHVRGLAKELKTNHMTISRRLNELLEENVVDFKKEGKNKIYFLKKNIESKAYIFMSESFKLVEILKKYPELRKIFESIQKNKEIKLAILFGSYAKGLAKKDSDIDIYIDTNDRKIKENIRKINSKVNVKIGGYDKESLLIKEIEKNSIVIKGVEVYYEKNKFFS